MRVLILLLALGCPLKAAIALVTSDLSGGTGASAISASINTTGATALLVFASWYSGGGSTATISDSKSNTWTCRTPQDTGIVKTEICYASNASPTVGSGHTFQVTTTAAFPSVGVMAFSGVLTPNPQDTESGASTVNAITLANGSITPGTASSVIVSGLSWNPNNPAESATIDNSATISNQISYSAGVFFAAAIAYKLNVSGATNLTWTLGATGGATAIVASFFKPAAAATGRVRHKVSQ